jgi:hypothetical protein
MPYDYAEHSHRFAAWAASRAAQRRVPGLTVQVGTKLIDLSGLPKNLEANGLAQSAEAFDALHQIWCTSIINAAKGMKIRLTYGVAAKLVNVYLKVRAVSGIQAPIKGSEFVHPPIDGILLRRLSRQAIGGRRDWHSAPWTQLNQHQYAALVSQIRQALDSAPLWQIEEHWKI